MRQLLYDTAVRNPELIGLVLAVLTGFAAYNCFQAGMTAAVIRGDAARMASEALGG